MRIYIFVFSLFMTGSVWALEPVRLLNASYDPTREFYADYNKSFAAKHKEQTGEEVVIRQSHGGSGKQARTVMAGLKADVVTLALGYDIDAIASKSGLIAKEWRTRLPNGGVPFYSTVIFLVRKGNPKQIHDWDDLIKEGVRVVTPNPKTSGGARWNYLAAWAYALKAHGGNEAKAVDYLRTLFAHVPVLDAGARGATTTFVQRGMGDVLLTWEAEAHLARAQFGEKAFDIIYPSLSIRADTPVAWVDAVVEKRGTQKIAEAYLKGLYEKEAQALATHHFFRPLHPQEQSAPFPAMPMISIESLGGWHAVHAKHFAEGGVFDQFYGERK